MLCLGEELQTLFLGQRLGNFGVSVLQAGKIRQEQNTRRAEAIVSRALQ